MGMTTSSTVTITCDRCGDSKSTQGRDGIVNWFRLDAVGPEVHPYGRAPFTDRVLCGTCAERAVTPGDSQ